MPAPYEIELKLVACGGGLTRVPRLFPGIRFERADVDSVYFDTVDDALRRHGMALRVRRDGQRWLQTLKVEDRARSVVARRGEWEFDLATPATPPGPDLAAFAATPLQDLIAAGTIDVDRLLPVFRSRFVRRRAIVRHRDSSIEVAIDHGELRVCDAGRGRQPIAEVELELKAGHGADVLHLAERIVRDARAVLVPALRSKAERGYALARGETLSVARASAAGFTRLMTLRLTRAQALRAVVGHALAIVVANGDALRAAPAVEHVHQARVALRRLRSAVRLFDPGHDDFPLRLAKAWRRLAGVLGEARDWDVLAESTLPDVIASREAVGSDDLPLVRWVQRKRASALQDAVAAVRSRRYARLVLATARWAASEPPAETPLLEAAPALADALADPVTSAARSFVTSSPRARHRVRVHAKRLRYALDLLRIAMPKQAVGGYVDALSELQDRLGELNDAAVAWERLRKAKLKRASVERVEAWHQAIEPALVRKAGRTLAALARRRRPWSTSPA